jgi:hypothetical protein
VRLAASGPTRPAVRCPWPRSTACSQHRSWRPHARRRPRGIGGTGRHLHRQCPREYAQVPCTRDPPDSAFHTAHS